MLRALAITKKQVITAMADLLFFGAVLWLTS